MKEETRLEGPFEFGDKPKNGRKCPKLTVSDLSEKTVQELGQELTPMQYNSAIKAIQHYNLHT